MAQLASWSQPTSFSVISYKTESWETQKDAAAKAANLHFFLEFSANVRTK